MPKAVAPPSSKRTTWKDFDFHGEIKPLQQVMFVRQCVDWLVKDPTAMEHTYVRLSPHSTTQYTRTSKRENSHEFLTRSEIRVLGTHSCMFCQSQDDLISVTASPFAQRNAVVVCRKCAK